MIKQVNGLDHLTAANNVAKTKSTYQFPRPGKLADSVQLSSDIMRVRTANTDPSRLQKINDIRTQLDNGTYLTPDKLNVALDRALDDVLKQIL